MLAMFGCVCCCGDLFSRVLLLDNSPVTSLIRVPNESACGPNKEPLSKRPHPHLADQSTGEYTMTFSELGRSSWRRSRVLLEPRPCETLSPYRCLHTFFLHLTSLKGALLSTFESVFFESGEGPGTVLIDLCLFSSFENTVFSTPERRNPRASAVSKQFPVEHVPVSKQFSVEHVLLPLSPSRPRSRYCPGRPSPVLHFCDCFLRVWPRSW